MSQLQEILKYQEIDKRLYALEREIAGCEERKEYLKAKKFLETAADKLDSYDAKAAQLKNMAVELTKIYLKTEDTLKDLIDGQTNPTIATYAKTGEVHIRVTASGENAKAAGKTIKPIVKELKSRFGGDIYSTREETTLEMAVADLLLANDLTVTTAESCTGGMIAARIINVPGVSECYKAGLVTYSNKAKRKFLGVRKSTLDKYGAVSSKTAGEMAKGAALLLKADVAVAVTGIAGPDGGTEEKPVGLVYIGCCVKGELTVKEYHFSGTRSQIREATTSAALILMRSCILKYFSKVTFGKK